MGLFAALVLGAVQAVTEFLPVSSTAHLLVLGELLGQSLSDPRFRAFATIIQMGTTLAVLVYFRDDLWRIGTAVVRGLLRGRPFEGPDAKLGWYIALGTVPAAVAGKLLERHIEGLGNMVIAISLVLWGLVLLAAERFAAHRRALGEVGAGDALAIGIGQAVALVPGTSRSGATLTAGMLLGFTREAAARFSFLLSVPIILGAGIYKLWKSLPALRGEVGWGEATVAATVVAAVLGYLVIGWLLHWLRTRSTYVFIAWRVALGVAMAVLIWKGVLPAEGDEAAPPAAVQVR